MYENIKALRTALIEERQLEKPGVPLDANDLLIVEARVQTALSVASATIADEVVASNVQTQNNGA